MRKRKLVPGDIVKIPYDTVYHVYAQITNYSDMAFFDLKTTEDISDMEIIANAPILFRGYVNDEIYYNDRWPLVGHHPIRDELKESKYWLPEIGHPDKCKIIYNGDWRWMQDRSQAEGLFDGGISNMDNVHDSIEDHYNGIPDRWAITEEPVIDEAEAARRMALFMAKVEEDNKKLVAKMKKTSEKKKVKLSNKTFPFVVTPDDGDYIVTAALEEQPLYPEYYDLFEKNGYEGNGPCWEGHIMQVLEKTAPELLEKIEFNSEASTFTAVFNSASDKDKFISVLSPIFSDLNKLEEWIKKADRHRIDD